LSGEYTVYLLRIWQVGEQNIRAMLEDPRTHETMGFSSLGALMDYLENKRSPVVAGDRQKTQEEYNQLEGE